MELSIIRLKLRCYRLKALTIRTRLKQVSQSLIQGLGSQDLKQGENRSLPLFNSLTRHISSVLSSSSLVTEAPNNQTDLLLDPD